MFQSIGRTPDPERWLRRIATVAIMVGSALSALTTLLVYKGARWVVGLVTALVTVLCAGPRSPRFDTLPVEIVIEDLELPELREPERDVYAPEEVDEQGLAAADAEWAMIEAAREEAARAAERGVELDQVVDLWSDHGSFAVLALVGSSDGGAFLEGTGSWGGLGGSETGLIGVRIDGEASGYGGLGTKGTGGGGAAVGTLSRLSPPRTGAPPQPLPPIEVAPRRLTQPEVPEEVRAPLIGPTRCAARVTLDPEGRMADVQWRDCPPQLRPFAYKALQESRWPTARDETRERTSLVDYEVSP